MENSESMLHDEARPAPERIGFGKRLGAYLLDLIVSGIIGAVIGIFAGTTLAALFFAGDYVEGSADAEAYWCQFCRHPWRNDGQHCRDGLDIISHHAA